MIEKILIADDDATMLAFAATVVRRKGYDVTLASDGMEAMRLIEAEGFDFILSDIKMPHFTGLDILKKAKGKALVVLATAHGTIELAVEAMKEGAFSFLLKPFSPDALENILEKAEEHLKLIKENTFYKEDKQAPEMVANSPAMQKILADLDKIAKSQASVFITGESGTGKEVIAGAIHALSNRAQHPFIKVNCAAIPEQLLESEFFGHEKGSFTGAHTKKTGRFELADKGTLLLDEVTEIPLVLQPKLLRAIQEQEFERVGGTRPIKVSLRFLATSNRNMQEAVSTKIFREDLFYRLNVVPLHLPPLRERKEDILPLANHFLNKFCKENHKPTKALSPAAIQKLLDYSWPGNVRELANIIERTVVLDFDPEITPNHLYLTTAPPPKPLSAMTLAAVEKEHILRTLEAHFQNRTKTADALGISIRTLRNKLHEYNETE